MMGAMTPRTRSVLIRLLLGLVLAASFIAHAMHWIELPLINRLENIGYDALVLIRADGSVPSEKVVILDIDEKSLAAPELGRWPWSRDKMSELVEGVFEHYQAAVLAFDVVFPEPDKSSGLDSMNQLAEGVLKDNVSFIEALKKLTPELDFDGRFEETIAARPIVLGYYFSEDSRAGKIGGLPASVLLAEDMKDFQTAFPAWRGYGGNLDRFAAAALVGGHFNPVVDIDGLVRRVPTLVAYEDEYYESLALAAARMYWAITDNPQGGALRLQPIEPLGPTKESGGLLEFLRVGTRVLPIDPASNILVPFREFGQSFSYVSMIDVLQRKVPMEQLRGKVLLVGTTAPGLVDLRATPLSGIYPGVEIHANVLASLIEPDRQPLMHRPSWVMALEVLATSLGALVLAILLPWLAPGVSTIVFVLVASAAAAGQYWLWHQGLVFHGATLFAAAVMIYLWNMAYGFFVEAQAKRQFTDLFGQYVPPELVEKMAENPERYDMSGQRKELTVLFSDVRGFTSISEKLSPSELAAYINEYLTEMSLVIRQEGGTLDKYIGDAIMAFWGAPVDEPRHAQNGIKAALRMRDQVKVLGDRFRERNWPELAIGVGLSTGDMTVGDMGSKVRKAYTVMGDAVNLGSRLEGLTKQYGAFCLVPLATKEACPEVVFREMDSVRVKGKAEPVKIFEPVCFVSDANDIVYQELARWHEAIALMRQQQWDQALEVLAALVSMYGEEYRVQILREKIVRLKHHPPGENWDGVTNFETK